MKDVFSLPGYVLLGLRKFSIWLHLVRLFIAPLGVLLVLLVALTCLGQGADVVRMMHEPTSSAPAVPFIHYPRLFWGEMAILLMALTCWYFARLLAYANDKDLRRVPRVRQHMPRFLGFSCFNVLLLAQLHAGVYCSPIGSGAAIFLFFLLGTAWYLLLDYWIRRLLAHWADSLPKAMWARSVSGIAIVLGLVATGGVFAEHGRLGLGLNTVIGIVGHVLVQTVFLFYLNLRHWYFKPVPSAPGGSAGAVQRGGLFDGGVRVARWIGQWIVKGLNRWFTPVLTEFRTANPGLVKALQRNSDRSVGGQDMEFAIEHDVGFMSMFMVFAVVLLAVFVAASADVLMAVRAGTLAIVVLGLTVLLSILCTAQLIARLKGVNVLALIVLIAVVTGPFNDPHDIYLPMRAHADKRSFDDRTTLKQYLSTWYHDREEEIRNCPAEYPMIFVLADGGASRSGYWVATVLGRLHDRTDSSTGGFDRHLFSLSGASGGSVGTGTYFALLYDQRARGHGCDSMEQESRRILQADLLTPTLASMLGADIVNLALPAVGLPDRARALERALQVADNASCFPEAFSIRLSQLVNYGTATDPVDQMPILHINTTRMQDGRPGVISTIDLSEKFYNRRVDVLDLLPEDTDMELATAMITGARFPYVSPAGHIHSDVHGDHYFVDGGYFDNSGAGITHEMIAQIFSTGKLLLDSIDVDKELVKKIRPYVIHIGNSKLVEPTSGTVSPLANDLAAPLTTMLGAYGMQTNVNDQRLKSMIERLYPDTCHYLDIQLYRDASEREDYPMNWAMSRVVRDRMDRRLDTHDQLNELVEYIRHEFVEELRPMNLP